MQRDFFKRDLIQIRFKRDTFQRHKTAAEESSRHPSSDKDVISCNDFQHKDLEQNILRTQSLVSTDEFKLHL